MTSDREPSVPSLQAEPSDLRAGRYRRLKLVAVGWAVGCFMVFMPISLHSAYLVRGPFTHTLQWTFSSFVTGWFAGERLNFPYWGNHRPYYFPGYDAWFWGSLMWASGLASLYVFRPGPWTKAIFIVELVLRSSAAAFTTFLFSASGV